MSSRTLIVSLKKKERLAGPFMQVILLIINIDLNYGPKQFCQPHKLVVKYFANTRHLKRTNIKKERMKREIIIKLEIALPKTQKSKPRPRKRNNPTRL